MEYPYPSREVENQIRNMFTEHDEFTFRARDDGYHITVKGEDGYISFSGYSTLMGIMKIAELLECNEGDESDRWQSEGCPTCDYGAKYEVSWKFWRT